MLLVRSPGYCNCRAKYALAKRSAIDTGWQSDDRYPGAMLRHVVQIPGHLDTDPEPNPVVDIDQLMKLPSPVLTQPSIVLASVGDDSGRSIENTLQLVGRLLRRSDQETATVVDPASDERTDDSSG